MLWEIIVGGTYPNAEGLVKFNGKAAEGNWTFTVVDYYSTDKGTIASVDLTITCE